jgi:pimeloyl-ACP methyl ester carboxylesterase
MHLGKSMKPLNKIEKILIEVQGLRFSALADGPVDGDLVLLLRGFPEFADAWLDVMRPIAEAGFRAVAVDQRGYSLSVSGSLGIARASFAELSEKAESL